MISIKRLVPPERVGRHDRGLMAAHDLDQVLDENPRRRLVERRQAVDQEVALAGRDLGPREDTQAKAPAPPVRQARLLATGSRAR